jgi:S-formylglutathione hydrolase FrmB
VVAAVALAASAPAGANQTNCAPYPPPPASPRIVHSSVDGLELNVLLPADYADSGTRRYPVLYLFHALSYNENVWLEQTDLEQFTKPFTGDRGVIVVTPDGGPNGGYRDWYDGSEQWETYHIDRLIPYVDSHFRTIADRAHRAIAGFSIGGYGATHYAARHPDLFTAVGSFSGIVDTTLPEGPYVGADATDVRTDAGSPGPIQFGPPPPPYKPPDDSGSGCGQSGSSNGNRVTEAIDWHNHNPTDLASNLRGLTVYLAAGNGAPCPDDPTSPPTLAFPIEPGARAMAESFDSALTKAGVAHTADLRSCGVHNIQASQRYLHAFWPLMEDAFAHPAQAPRGSDYRTADRDFSVWGWSFHADPKRAPEFLEVRHPSKNGVLLTGSGTETVTTGPLFHPRQRVTVTGALPASATADSGGRVTVVVDLGPPHDSAQFSPGAPSPSFVSRLATFDAGSLLPARHRCVDRRKFTFGLHHARRTRVVDVRVYVNGRQKVHEHGRKISRVTLRRLPKRRFRVKIVATQNDGSKLISTRTYRGCTKSRPKTHRRAHQR